jgi:hypothetical protein
MLLIVLFFFNITSPIHLLMAKEMEDIPTGRYYGSDAIRSPLDVYRGPGDPPYEPDDDE